jgi:hypothetical protein
MQYNQPYGMPTEVNLGDYPYINGDPVVGRAGSIPPGASIEYDQREIVRVIQWAFDNKYIDQYGNPCLAPTNSYLDQLLKALFGILNSRMLRAPRNYYVNAATGSDTNDGLTATTAFLTIQRALNVAITWNQNGFPVTINVADGVYDGVVLPPLNGSGGCNLVGSGTGTCTISGVNKSAILQVGQSPGVYSFGGFALGSNGIGAPGDNMCGIQMYAGNNAIGNVKFLNCVGFHMQTITGASLAQQDAIEIAGNAQAHIFGQWGSHIVSASPPHKPVLTISKPVTFGTSFALASDGSIDVVYYVSITGAANVTGPKYAALSNGIIDTSGSGVSYLPGSSAGYLATGGQYV